MDKFLTMSYPRALGGVLLGGVLLGGGFFAGRDQTRHPTPFKKFQNPLAKGIVGVVFKSKSLARFNKTREESCRVVRLGFSVGSRCFRLAPCLLSLLSWLSWLSSLSLLSWRNIDRGCDARKWIVGDYPASVVATPAADVIWHTKVLSSCCVNRTSRQKPCQSFQEFLRRQMVCLRLYCSALQSRPAAPGMLWHWR